MIGENLRAGIFRRHTFGARAPHVAGGSHRPFSFSKAGRSSFAPRTPQPISPMERRSFAPRTREYEAAVSAVPAVINCLRVMVDLPNYTTRI
jgi:hypothetical protein